MIPSYAFQDGVRKDLIYEGITTSIKMCSGKPHLVRKDLIYEGITTVVMWAFEISTMVRKDLIYEGITTWIQSQPSP